MKEASFVRNFPSFINRAQVYVIIFYTKVQRKSFSKENWLKLFRWKIIYLTLQLFLIQFISLVLVSC